MDFTEKEWDEIIRICEKIGVHSVRDIAYFETVEKREDETLLEAMQRYEEEFDSIPPLNNEEEIIIEDKTENQN